MKLLRVFVFGAITGACVLWFGFSKVILTLNDQLVAVDRFTGRASKVHVSSMEAEQLEQDEAARLDALTEKETPNEKELEWRELSESEINRLEFRWSENGGGGSIIANFHNPFEKEVKIERVRVQIPARQNHAAIDREYQLANSPCLPLADGSDSLTPMRISFDEFLEPGTSGDNPSRIVGSITPVRVLIRN
jgi:hypothetical protein